MMKILEFFWDKPSMFLGIVSTLTLAFIILQLLPQYVSILLRRNNGVYLLWQTNQRSKIFLWCR